MLGGGFINTEILLSGEKIALCRMSNCSWHDFYKNYVIDPMMNANLYIYDWEQIENAYYLKTNDAKRLYFSIMLDKKVIGQIYLKHINKVKKKAEFGITLVDDTVKGRGYGTEAIKLLILYAFDTLGLKTIIADSVLRNTRSQHVLQKVGFQYTHEDLIFKYYKIDKICTCALYRAT